MTPNWWALHVQINKKLWIPPSINNSLPELSSGSSRGCIFPRHSQPINLRYNKLQLQLLPLFASPHQSLSRWEFGLWRVFVNFLLDWSKIFFLNSCWKALVNWFLLISGQKYKIFYEWYWKKWIKWIHESVENNKNKILHVPIKSSGVVLDFDTQKDFIPS